MKLSLSWIREHIDLDLTANQIAKILTSLGLEIDGVHEQAPAFQGVVVGTVVHVEKHPNADKLCVATVTDGTQNYQVVCGAPNCRIGIKTALALAGATLPDASGQPFKVKHSKLRGVESFGMLCSSKELLLGDEEDAILEFTNYMKEGADIGAHYADTIFEISLTPNLGHCASLIGVVRELAAATGKTIHFPETAISENETDAIQQQVHVSIADAKGCPRYSCRLIRNVKIGPSPEWLQHRLEASGIRPINNIVDVTNYVTLELGQPLHAFDFDMFDGPNIIVRTAQADEEFTTLDGKKRILAETDLLICDQCKPLAIAGVMGGLNSEVSAKTTNILLESAYFAAKQIRKTSKRLGLQTDASKRFERGCDPNQTLQALNRAAMLIEKLADGQIVKGYLDVKSCEFPDKMINCRLSRICKILGKSIALSEVETFFQRLGFQYKWDGQDLFTVTIPTYRVDISEEIDLVEEVARLYGYDNLGRPEPVYRGSKIPDTAIFTFERLVRSRLLAEGLQEFITCDLIGPTLCEIVSNCIVPEASIVRVLNPTSIEQSILRTSLLPGLLQIVRYNIDHQNHNINGFEIGKVHFKDEQGYREPSVAGIILSGKSAPHNWQMKSQEVDFYLLKGILENVLNELQIEDIVFTPSSFPMLHPGRQASIICKNIELGSFGEIHPGIQRRLDVPQRMLFAELNLHDLMKVQAKDQKMKEIPIYPSSERDWTVTLNDDVAIEFIFEAIREAKSPLLENFMLLDLYRSDKLGAGLKNATFRFIFRDSTKTIAQEAVDEEHARIISEILKNPTLTKV